MNFSNIINNFAKETEINQYFNILINTDFIFVAEPKHDTKYFNCLENCQNMMVLDKQENEFIGRYHNVAVALLGNKLICRPLA